METLLPPTETKANKEHKCSFCNERISKGETYLKSTHKFDGELYDWRSHINCGWIASKLKLYDDCEEGLTQDDFIESIREEFYTLMINRVEKDDFKKYQELFGYLRSVYFKQQLVYVIHHYKKLEKLNSEQNPERSVATMPNSSNEADKQIKQNPFGG